jgi:hypothetical protein
MEFSGLIMDNMDGAAFIWFNHESIQKATCAVLNELTWASPKQMSFQAASHLSTCIKHELNAVLCS